MKRMLARSLVAFILLSHFGGISVGMRFIVATVMAIFDVVVVYIDEISEMEYYKKLTQYTNRMPYKRYYFILT